MYAQEGKTRALEFYYKCINIHRKPMVQVYKDNMHTLSANIKLYCLRTFIDISNR